MKKILIIFLTLAAFAGAAEAQVDSVGQAIALHIAERIKDTLSLTQSQQDSIYEVNILLHLGKQIEWQKNEPETLSQRIQDVENMRDSLYQPILSPEQFILYQEKKHNLINAI